MHWRLSASSSGFGFWMTASDQIWHQGVVFLYVLIRKPAVLFWCVLCVVSDGDRYFGLNFFGLVCYLPLCIP